MFKYVSRFGFWRQKEDIDFEYTEEYREAQSTNEAMAYLRLGWLLGYIPPEALRTYKVVDVGAGNCAMEKYLGKHVKTFKSYDVVGESITREELYGTKWDLAIFSDVIEHMEDLEDFVKIPWKKAYVSFPETPKVLLEDLKDWRHYKPGEHLWMLNLEGMKTFCKLHGLLVNDHGNPEDIIRKGQCKYIPNITSMLLTREKDYETIDVTNVE